MKNVPQFILSLITTTGLIALVFCLLKLEILPANQRIIDMIVGAIIGQWVQQQGFWFSTTASSKDKDDTISQIAKTPIAPIAPVAVVAPVAPVAPVLPIAPIEKS